MGRRTFESIGRPLPNRVNVVLTRSPSFSAKDVRVVGSLAEGLELARSAGETEAFVIGGTSLYAAALPIADAIHLTRVHADLAGDAFFPDPPRDAWIEVLHEHHPSDARHAYAFTHTLLERATPRNAG
jgi:dihydrofolate reductase